MAQEGISNVTADSLNRLTREANGK